MLRPLTHLVACLVVIAMAASVVTYPAVASPTFGPGCVTITEFERVKTLGPGITRARVHRIFGHRGVLAVAGLYGWSGPSRVYGPCNEAAWDRRYGDGPKYWIVQAQYRDGILLRIRAINWGYRP
jgi:hypothetical protein